MSPEEPEENEDPDHHRARAKTPKRDGSLQSAIQDRSEDQIAESAVRVVFALR